jgi:hypothetical protein
MTERTCRTRIKSHHGLFAAGSGHGFGFSKKRSENTSAKNAAAPAAAFSGLAN